MPASERCPSQLVGYAYNPDGSVAALTNELGRVWFYDYETGGACCGGGLTTGTVTDPLGRQTVALHSAHGLRDDLAFGGEREFQLHGISGRADDAGTGVPRLAIYNWSG